MGHSQVCEFWPAAGHTHYWHLRVFYMPSCPQHGLQTSNIGKPRRGLQIMNTRMGFPCPFLGIVIDSISLTCACVCWSHFFSTHTFTYSGPAIRQLPYRNQVCEYVWPSKLWFRHDDLSSFQLSYFIHRCRMARGIYLYISRSKVKVTADLCQHFGSDIIHNILSNFHPRLTFVQMLELLCNLAKYIMYCKILINGRKEE